MKKCKFCNGNGIIKKEELAYYAVCENCGARTPYTKTEEEAEEAWDELMTKKEGNNG